MHRAAMRAAWRTYARAGGRDARAAVFGVDSSGNNGNDDHDDLLDEEFPLGDGTADLAASVECPYCGAAVEVALDPGSGSEQEYVEDCEVCCQPWRVVVRYGADGQASVRVSPLNE